MFSLSPSATGRVHPDANAETDSHADAASCNDASDSNAKTEQAARHHADDTDAGVKSRCNTSANVYTVCLACAG